jgi:transposase-like protein
MTAAVHTRVTLPPETVGRMRVMYGVARSVRGGTPVDHPSRQVSVEFSELLAALVAQGVTVYQIAQTLGVTHAAIRFRLSRHGHRNPVPSQADIRYRGVQSSGPWMRSRRLHREPFLASLADLLSRRPDLSDVGLGARLSVAAREGA